MQIIVLDGTGSATGGPFSTMDTTTLPTTTTTTISTTRSFGSINWSTYYQIGTTRPSNTLYYDSKYDDHEEFATQCCLANKDKFRIELVSKFYVQKPTDAAFRSEILARDFLVLSRSDPKNKCLVLNRFQSRGSTNLSVVELIFETITDLILQNYYNSTLYPPLGQMSLNNDAENLIVQQSNDSLFAPIETALPSADYTHNYTVNVSLVVGDWPIRPTSTAESTKSSVVKYQFYFISESRIFTFKTRAYGET